MVSMASSSRRGRTRKSSSISHPSNSLPKTEVVIHVYDLLPPGRLSSFLWTIGGGLLHSGVVIQEREYAYGGHDRKGVSGVYWTRPKLEPPGGTFRCEILHGFTFFSQQEITDIINETSAKFQGTSYNLLTNNCNHFTSYLCERLTGKPAPTWLNRAASVGLALPCMVPKEWITPPDHDTADGELVDEDMDDEDDEDDEHAAMLRSGGRQWERESSRIGSNSEAGRSSGTVQSQRLVSRTSTPPPRVVSLHDTSGRDVPAAEHLNPRSITMQPKILTVVIAALATTALASPYPQTTPTPLTSINPGGPIIPVTTPASAATCTVDVLAGAELNGCTHWPATTTTTALLDCRGCALASLYLGPGPVCESRVSVTGTKTVEVVRCAASLASIGAVSSSTCTFYQEYVTKIVEASCGGFAGCAVVTEGGHGPCCWHEDFDNLYILGSVKAV
ncbi:hypothetical protein M8818_006880 [Zalaria obscura]|uniref:Uncharacterized protein n=1 Tax=Zalaria obscura TaxID=2024903 RepID=A0ACC3S674_9PEZI